MDINFSGLVLTYSSENVSNLCNGSPCTSVRSYWIFTPDTIVPDTLRFTLKFLMNNKNSSGSPLSNKAIINSLRYDICDFGSLHNLILKQYLFNFSSLLLLTGGFGGGSTCTCTYPVFQLLLCKTFFITEVFFFASSMLGNCFEKFHTPYVFSSIARKTIDDNILS